MAKIRNEELDRLGAEVLPERAVLGLIGPVGHGGTTIASACQGSTDPARGAAAAMLAVAPSGGNSLQCFPAVINDG